MSRGLPPAVRQGWRNAIRSLREECPLLLPVRIVLDRRLPPPGRDGRLIAWANTTRDESGFRIVVRTRVRERGSREARRLHRSELIESLVHEWAHCLTWTSDQSTLEDHGPAWGVAYAACYRTVIEE